MTKKTLVGVQFLFVAFGATVLVPLLIGIDPATALFTAGVGTFLFHFITKGKVPIFLGSSFAFIAPIIAATKQWGLPGTIAGLTSVSLVYFAMSALVKWQGKKLLDRIFPPVVIGPAIILIGHDMALMAHFVTTLGVMYRGELIEVGPVRDVFANPQHEYTRMLINSLPSFDRQARFIKAAHQEASP